MDVHDLDWGDVVVDTGDVMVCQATWSGEPVVAKRWRGGALDAELACRRALQDAGVPCLELLGCGQGWMVVEDMGGTPWRPATAEDLEDPGVVRRLGAWFARVHGIGARAWFADTPGLDRTDLLTGATLETLARALPRPVGAVLPRAVASWRAQLHAVPQVMLVGSLDEQGTAVMGDGLDAMATDLSLAHAGAAVSDLVLVWGMLPARLFEEFVAAYETVAGPVDHGSFQAALGMSLAVDLVLEEFRDGQLSPATLSQLSALAVPTAEGSEVTD